MIKTAIVILNWNGSKMLQQFLPSVIQHSSAEDVEIYVADNASTDDSLAILETEFPEVRRIILEENYGYTGGYNLALKQIDATYYILLNSDIEVTEGWLTPLIGYLDEHPETACCQPKIRSWKDKKYFEYAGACGGFIDHYGYPFCRGRIFDVVEEDHGQYDTIMPVFWATGAALVIRSSDYWKVGGLDDRFFAHMEEVDLCWRLLNRDRSIVCIPQSKVYHVGGATLNKSNPRKTFLNFRNNLIMLYKNLPEDQLTSVLRVRRWLDYLAMFVFILKGNRQDAKAIRKARKAFLKMKPELQQERSGKAYKPVTDLPGWEKRSILVQYYIKGKKTFSELRACLNFARFFL